MKKPEIVYLIYDTNYKGGNKIVFEQATRLQNRGYKIIIFSLFATSPIWFNLKIPIHKYSSSTFFKHLFNPSIILIATFWPTAYLSIFFRSKKKFYLVQGLENKFYKNILLRTFAKLSYKIPTKKIVISTYIEDELRRFCKPDSITKIYGNGIDTSLFKPNIKNKKGKTILSVISAYKWYKGIDILAKTARQLKKIHPEYTFILVSGSEDKVYDPVFDIFYNNITTCKLINLYQKSSVLLCTSRMEGFFLPGIEAMACKCLFITSDNGGIREYANSNNSIIVSEIASLWQNDIIGKILCDSKTYNRLIKNAYQTAQSFEWNKIIDDLETILTKD